MFRTSAIFVPLDVVTICWLRYFKSTLLRYKKLRWYSVHRLYPTSLHYFVVGVVTFVTRYEKLWLRYSLLTPYVHVQTWLFPLYFVSGACWCSWFVSILYSSWTLAFSTLVPGACSTYVHLAVRTGVRASWSSALVLCLPLSSASWSVTRCFHFRSPSHYASGPWWRSWFVPGALSLVHHYRELLGALFLVHHHHELCSVLCFSFMNCTRCSVSRSSSPRTVLDALFPVHKLYSVFCF